MTSDYLPRLVDPVIDETLRDLPVLSLVGPRGAGKTTSAQRVARATVRCDRLGDTAAFRVDPDAALNRLPRPALLDEWHLVPHILGAVKRRVDADPSPGQLLLTGSVQIGTQYTWPATGRVVRQTVHGLTVRETERSTVPPFIERLRDEVDSLADTRPSTHTLFDYLELAAVGGFPDAVLHRQSSAARSRWYEGYLHELLTNDVKLANANPDPTKFRPYVEAMAHASSRLVDQATLRDLAGIAKATAAAYEDLLESVFFCQRVPAWRSSTLARLVTTPKRYLLDTGLLMHVLGVGVDDAAADSRILGAVLDTFVAAQIRPEIAVEAPPPLLLHARDGNGRREVDLIVEWPRHRVTAIEVKVTTAPHHDDARHLIWLRDQLGDSFVAGAVLHTGPASFMLSERIVATPISTLWQP